MACLVVYLWSGRLSSMRLAYLCKSHASNWSVSCMSGYSFHFFPFSSYCPAEIKVTAIIHSLIEKVLEMHLKVWTSLQPLSRPQHCTNSQPIYSEWIRSSVHYNSPEFLLLIHVVWSFLCCSLLFTPGCSLHSAVSFCISIASHPTTLPCPAESQCI